MRRFRLLSIVLVMAATAAACGSDGDGGDDGASASTVVATITIPMPSTTAGSTVPPTNLTLKITDVHLVNSEESDSGMRVLLPAGVTSASVTLTGVPSPNRVILVCQARELDRRMAGAACRTPASGEPVTVTLGTAASGVEVVQVGVAGPGPTGNAAKVDEVTIRYAASSREVNARLQQIAAGERPSFALTPASADGAYRANLTWTVIPVFGGSASNGQLELVAGGNVANQAQGGAGGVQLDGNVAAAAGDVAIRAQNVGEAALVSPKVTLLLP